MAIEGTASTEIEAPIAVVFAAAADAAGATRWQPELSDAEVLKRDVHGNQVRVRFCTDIKVRKVVVEMAFAYHEPHGLGWWQASGPLKSIDGRWRFEELGPDRTRATCTMKIDPGHKLGLLIRGPLVGMLRRLLVEAMPPRFKEYVESGLRGAARAPASSADSAH